jgi:mannosylglucosylglycerate synthase
MITQPNTTTIVNRTQGQQFPSAPFVHQPTKPASLRIGFISTRFAGTDGVSLETQKWAALIERMGHHCFYFAGEADTPPSRSHVVPEAFFGHPHVSALQQAAFSYSVRPPALTRHLHELKDYLKAHLITFVRTFAIEVLVVENALTIPMHIPLGLALTEFIAETGIPTIAHHHDFYWERHRFLTSCVDDYLAMSFPPRLPTIRHVVINSIGARQLSHHTGCTSLLIPNVMDFDHPPSHDPRSRQLRSDLRLTDEEQLVLQPTRIIQRKGIEHAVELLSRLGVRARLVISHASGDEGDDYCQRVRAFAAVMGVQVEFVAHLIDDQRRQTAATQQIYALGDIYQQANLVTYPSLVEGFGNAFLEAVYYRRPIVVNTYPIFGVDIKPKGFRVVTFQDYITDQTVRETLAVLENPRLAHAMADHNYEIACRHYSYTALEQRLRFLLAEMSHMARPMAFTDTLVSSEFI